VLDTLYELITFSLPPTSARRVTMTYFHGLLSKPLVFSGFSIWDYTRSDCQTLVDFVLQDMWGLSKTPPVVAAPVAANRMTQPVDSTPRATPRGVAIPSRPDGGRTPFRE
jgi:hypothetical protein